MTKTLHLMTQRDQPMGSERRCCERCGLMMICRPDSFWREHAHTDDERQYHDKHPGHITCASMHEGGGKTP
jgi:hypothetical protein